MRPPLSIVLIITTSLLISACCNTKCKTVREVKYQLFSDYPVYEGNDLGAIVNSGKTCFKLWAPEAKEVKLRLYKTGDGDKLIQTVSMVASEQGTWSYHTNENLHGVYYTYQTLYNDQWNDEVADIYARTSGVNGHRGMVVDLNKTNPKNWEDDQKPALNNINDIILYELHVRDISSHNSSGITDKGKFTGLVEEGTKSPDGLFTGLDHIKDLGVTHVHILPAFDFHSVDEAGDLDSQFNWGYDPVNYNAPEGSYASDPYNGEVRIQEFKQMVQGFHKAGIRVIMDVVYNHTGPGENSTFNQLVPDYYYRQWEDGKWSNASACGNETASDRAMMRKFMIESVAYWANEYHIDGFRFDLMGIHDIETMNQITDTLKAIDPSIFIYGEGWTAADSPLKEKDRALKAHAKQMPDLAVFSDDMRDAIKGHWSDYKQKGFVSGKKGFEESVKYGIVGSVQHPDIDYSKVNYSKEPWANTPSQTINYVSCHDNHTLYDKLHESNPNATEEQIMAMHRLANTIVLTSQGIPFLHAGVEFGRTKFGVENSYNAPDSINQIRWGLKAINHSQYVYYRNLIQMRKNHPAFRMSSTKDIQDYIKIRNDIKYDNVIAYNIAGAQLGDEWEDIFIVFNGKNKSVTYPFNGDGYKLICDGREIDEDGLSIDITKGKKIIVPPHSAIIMVK